MVAPEQEIKDITISKWKSKDQKGRGREVEEKKGKNIVMENSTSSGEEILEMLRRKKVSRKDGVKGK